MPIDIASAEGLERLRRARADFLGGQLRHELETQLPGDLLAAWRRALFYGVRPEADTVPRVSGPPTAVALADVAAPVLDRLGASLTDTQVAVVLSDARARIEHCRALTPTVRAHLDRIGTGPGADLSERATGMNGISAVVHTGRSALVRGPQHILGLYQETTCAGAPVRDPLTRRVRGVLSLVCGLEVPAALLTTLADTAAAAIERELLHQAEPRERLLLDAYLAARADAEVVLVLDGRTRLVSEAAGGMLTSEDLDVLDEMAVAAVRSGRTPVPGCRLPGSGATGLLREVRDGGRVVGLVVELAADRPDARDGDRRRAADLPPPLPGLVGVSPSWRGLLRRVAAVGSAPAVVVIGEPGSGTTSVADAMTGGQEVARLDAAEAVLGEPRTWLAGLATAVRSEHPVVLMDADRLPADLAPSVALLLEQHPPVRLVLAGRPPGPGRPWWRSLLRNGCEELVEVPPLRDRVEDLPGLLALGPGPALRFTVDAGTALRRYRWPGNVAELRRLVDRLRIGVGNRRAIGLEDLPEDVAAALHGRWIGELEQAELRAIRAHDGNRARAAVALGISRATLYRKLHHYGVTGR